MATKYKKKLDTVFSRYIRLKYADKKGFVSCYTCSKKDEAKHLQNGHYVSRTHNSTRFSVDNCRPQCYRCNVAMNGNFQEFTLRLLNEHGQEYIDKLLALKHLPTKISDIEYMAQIKFYEEEVEKLLDEKNLMKWW